MVLICQLQSRAKLTKYRVYSDTAQRIKNGQHVHTQLLVSILWSTSSPPGKMHSVELHVDRMSEKLTTTEVCLIDTYTGSGFENYRLSS